MKRFLSILLTLILTTSVFMFSVSAVENAPAAAKTADSITFSDVDKSTATGQAIYKLANAGILVGDGNGIFRPNDPITRAELSKIVNSIFKYTEKAETGFTDLSGNEWYYDHVLIAKKAGYIVGYDDGTFRGGANVTREQACAILCRTASLYEISLNIQIADSVSSWAMPYVQTVLGNALMPLETGNTFRAMQNITRAEFSATFANFVQESNVEENKTQGNNSAVGGGASGGSSSGGSSSSGGGSSSSGSGGSSGGSSSGGTTKPNVKEENREMLINLQLVSQDIDIHLNKFPTEYPRKLITIIKETIDKTIVDGKTEIIDAKFVKTKYAAEIKEAKGYYDIIMADNSLKTRFQEALANLNTATINWLATEFGLLN